MHEEALFRDLRRALDRTAAQHGADRLVGARVWIGAFSHVSEERLRAAWPDLVRGGPAEGARLEIDRSEELTDPRADRLVLSSVVLPDVPPARSAAPRAQGPGRGATSISQGTGEG